MPYYNDKREYFNGGLILYQRDLEVSNPIAKTHNKPKWYMRVKIKGMKGCLIESNDGTARKLRVCNAKKDTANGKRRQHHLFNRILFSTICI